MDDSASEPGCVITATLDVDGPSGSVTSWTCSPAPRRASSRFQDASTIHFHLTADDTRILNYVEWISLEHTTAVENAELVEIYRISLETPACKPLAVAHTVCTEPCT